MKHIVSKTCNHILDIYYAGADVLQTTPDFEAMTLAYLERAADDGVVHAEIFSIRKHIHSAALHVVYA